MERGKLKLIFSEIIEGYSLVTSKLFGDLKIKHINNFDAAKTDIKNHHYFEKAVEQGLPKKEAKRLKKVLHSVSIGPKMYFASQTIAIVNNELDIRGI